MVIDTENVKETLTLITVAGGAGAVLGSAAIYFIKTVVRREIRSLSRAVLRLTLGQNAIAKGIAHLCTAQGEICAVCHDLEDIDVMIAAQRKE